MVDGPHDVGVLRREAVGDLSGAIGAAVVDGDDLEAFGDGLQVGEGLLHERLDVLGLVVRREEVAQGLDACRERAVRSSQWSVTCQS